MKTADRRPETVASPQELVSAAEDALQRFLRRNVWNEGPLYRQFYKALDAAYTAVTTDPTLGPKYEQLLDETVNNFPRVQSGRVSAESAKAAYSVAPYSPFWDGVLMIGDGVNLQDTVFLLRKVISTK